MARRFPLSGAKLKPGPLGQDIYCHAQESAIPFYEKLEYQTEGDKSIEAGIVHQIMTKALDCEIAV